MDGVFIFMGGNKPSVDFLMNQVEMTDGNCIVVNEEMMTSVPGVLRRGCALQQHKAGGYCGGGWCKSSVGGGQIPKQEGKDHLPMVNVCQRTSGGGKVQNIRG